MRTQPARRLFETGQYGRAEDEDILVKTWSVPLLAAAMVGLVALPAAAEDVVVARVNGNDIKQSDLDFAATEVGSRLATYTPADRRKILLQYVIENELMAEAGQKDSLDKGPTFPDRVKYHERRALRDAFFDADIANAVTEDAAKKIYDEKITQIKPEQEIHARHILVDTEAEAKEIEERLKKGEDFATLAKEKSKDANSEGGDLGFFTRGTMLKQFEDAAFALEVGQISDPVQTQFGWHIIKVEEKRDQPLPTFDQVKEAIIAQLVQQKAQEVVTGLRASAKVEVVDPELKKSMGSGSLNDEALPELPQEQGQGVSGGQQ
jgi:peptidyl-prolyl cis-trans isomerase C